VRKLLAAAIVAAVLMAAPAAQASTTIPWVPKAHYPCNYGVKWVLLPVDGITSATLTVEGTQYPMKIGMNYSYVTGGMIRSWGAESVGRVDASTHASVTYEGPAKDASLDIGACEMVPPSPTPTPTPPPTTTPPPTSPPPTSSSTTPPPTSSSPPPSTSTSTSPPPTTTNTASVAAAGGSNPGPEPCATPPCDTAFTGNATWPFVVIVGLLIVGTTLAWIARKRSQA
jgi:hypothetical protein